MAATEQYISGVCQEQGRKDGHFRLLLKDGDEVVPLCLATRLRILAAVRLLPPLLSVIILICYHYQFFFSSLHEDEIS